MSLIKDRIGNLKLDSLEKDRLLRRSELIKSLKYSRTLGKKLRSLSVVLK